MERLDLLTLAREEMTQWAIGMGWPRFRANQILQWIYHKGTLNFAEMTNLPQPVRLNLEETAWIGRLRCLHRQESSDGTQKFLFQLSDGKEIETVLIPDDGDKETDRRPRRTLCLSTQVGCTLDCRFCLTGRMGLSRNLKAHEIVQQVVEVQRLGHRLTNLVFMGMGEPLANDRELLEAIRRLTDPLMVGISPRRITVSTSGLIPQIQYLGSQAPGVNLAISLNATTERIRTRIMPAVNQLYSLSELISACRKIHLRPRQRITFEYVLLSGINDSEDDAYRLLRLLQGIRCKLNLIPFNEFSGSSYQRPPDERIERFQGIMRRAQFPVLIRRSRGRDILAACGQLSTIQEPRSDPSSMSRSG